MVGLRVVGFLVVGRWDGWGVGEVVGELVGDFEGSFVGSLVGSMVGDLEGALVGLLAVGDGVVTATCSSLLSAHS